MDGREDVKGSLYAVGLGVRRIQEWKIRCKLPDERPIERGTQERKEQCIPLCHVEGGSRIGHASRHLM